MVTAIPAQSPCPCGSGALFSACCGAVISGARPAATAEELMRSRYTAHVIGDYRYLHRTFLETAHRPYREEEPPDIQWTRLEIHSHEPGATPDRATVDFSAYFEQDGEANVLREKSEFHRTAQGWIYAKALRHGPPPVRTAQAKVGRNDPCPCGSGKKYKQCCLTKR